VGVQVDEHEDLLYAIVAKDVAKCYLNYNPMPCSKKPSNCKKNEMQTGVVQNCSCKQFKATCRPDEEKGSYEKRVYIYPNRPDMKRSG
jgi:hydrogenase maturation factor